jgi:glycosyltransferase involved in cell wall biosynthesis
MAGRPMKRHRVLVLANDCNPEWPSLPVVGYKACRSLSKYADVTVATHVRNREAVLRHGLGQAKVTFIDNEYIAAPLYKAAEFLRGGSAVAWTLNVAMVYPSILAFEWEVWKAFASDLNGGKFDIVHRITPMSPTLPSPMASWSPVPFVLGPLNGGLKWPKAFRSELRREREWLVHVRSAYKLMAYYRATYQKSAAILAAFDHTIQDLPRSVRARTINFPEVGIDPDLFNSVPRDTNGEQVTFLYVGRLVPYKCADVAVAAFAASPLLKKHRLRIVGDGPDRAKLEQMIRENELESCVELVGRRTQSEVAAIMREADVLTFPSIRELGAGVVVEAMACGRTCVVVDYGGPGGLINSARGVKVPLASKDELVRSFARELEKLAVDPQRRLELGQKAQSYSLREYSWDAKALKMIEVYKWVLGQRRDRPVFEGMP